MPATRRRPCGGPGRGPLGRQRPCMGQAWAGSSLSLCMSDLVLRGPRFSFCHGHTCLPSLSRPAVRARQGMVPCGSPVLLRADAVWCGVVTVSLPNAASGGLSHDQF